jgi:hypothetical protein
LSYLRVIAFLGTLGSTYLSSAWHGFCCYLDGL